MAALGRKAGRPIGQAGPGDLGVVVAELVLAGALIGLLLGVLGAGGAIFTAPLLIFAFDVPPREATTVSLVVVLLAAASGLLGYRGTDVVQWRGGAVFGAVGTIAAVVGSWLATVLSDRVLTGGFSILLLVAMVGVILLSKKELK